MKIVSKAPLRISLFGGGTDYPLWYSKNNGQVIGFSINRYCSWGRSDSCSEMDREYVKKLEQFTGVPSLNENLKSCTDHFIQKGLGASSALANSLLMYLYKKNNLLKTQYDIALNSINFEQDFLKMHVGSQDQVLTAMGGINHVKFSAKEIECEPLKLSSEFIDEFENSLILVEMGKRLTSSDVAKKYINVENKNFSVLDEMTDLVNEGKKLFENKECISSIGKLLNDSWDLKKDLISDDFCTSVDEYLKSFRRKGILGGKLLGAGEGGYLLMLVPAKLQDTLDFSGKNIVSNLKIDFKGAHLV